MRRFDDHEQLVLTVNGSDIARVQPTGFDVITHLRRGRVSMTWGTAVTLTASLGDFFELTATTNVAAVITPINPPIGSVSQRISVEIFNNTGGALSTAPNFATGSNNFRLTAAAVNPANGQSVVYTFVWSNIWGRWVESSRTIAY